MQYSLDNLFKDKIGVGSYQIILFLILISVDTSEGMQLTLMSLIVPIVQHEWDLSPNEVKYLSSIFFCGVILGNSFHIDSFFFQIIFC
jgi:hypothetical protein